MIINKNDFQVLNQHYITAGHQFPAVSKSSDDEIRIGRKIFAIDFITVFFQM